MRVQTPAALMDYAIYKWGEPEFILCDRFRLNDLLDWNERHRIPIIPRVTRWSEASEDIRALRKMAKDGPLSVAAEAATLIGASLAVARVKSDDAGSMRLVKRGTNNQSRDDVAAASDVGGWGIRAGAGQVGSRDGCLSAHGQPVIISASSSGSAHGWHLDIPERAGCEQWAHKPRTRRC